MTKDRGRGVFTTKPLKRGDLIVVEKAVAEAKQDPKWMELSFIDSKPNNEDCHRELVKICSDLV